MAIKREMKFYTPEEFRKYIDIARKIALEEQEKNKNLYEWNYYVFFNIAFYTGLRKGEIHALRWSDIDNNYLSVKRSITQKLHKTYIETPPKNRSSMRTIQIPLPLIKILNEHKERQKFLGYLSEDNRVLGDEKCIRDGVIDKRNNLYSSLAGVKRIRIHDFRHSHASLLANMGINIQEVARRLGHARVEMTWNTYSHLYPREEEKAIAVLNAV
ncbi:MAG: site-specific integrase [Oscillospiraceae bacterium]|nr:site-specific integrase [Oscillospiraceae bacterium]